MPAVDHLEAPPAVGDRERPQRDADALLAAKVAAIAGQLDHIGRNIMDREEMAEVMSKAVADGIRAAVSDPKMWAAAGSAMQTQAVNATGSLVIDGLKAGARKALFVAFVAGGIYWVGGWSALAAAWKAFTGGGHP